MLNKTETEFVAMTEAEAETTALMLLQRIATALENLVIESQNPRMVVNPSPLSGPNTSNPDY